MGLCGPVSYVVELSSENEPLDFINVVYSDSSNTALVEAAPTNNSQYGYKYLGLIMKLGWYED